MKHVEKIYYTCDICGDECEPTPQYLLPEIVEEYAHDEHGTKLMAFNSIKGIQNDLCPRCQKKLVCIISGMKKLKEVKRAKLSMDDRDYMITFENMYP